MRQLLPLLLSALCLAGCQTGSQPNSLAASGGPETTVDQVCQITSELMGVDRSKVTPTTSLEDLGCDDLDVVELVMEFEEHFDVTIPDDEFEKLGNATMEKLAALVDVQKRQDSE